VTGRVAVVSDEPGTVKVLTATDRGGNSYDYWRDGPENRWDEVPVDAWLGIDREACELTEPGAAPNAAG
jgi:hypothetical protein